MPAASSSTRAAGNEIYAGHRFDKFLILPPGFRVAAAEFDSVMGNFFFFIFGVG